MQAIITVIVIQAAVNVFLIWSNKRKGNEDFYLIALMSLFLIHTAFKYVLLLIYHDSEIFNKLHGSFSLLYGPFLWQYFCSVTGKNLSFRIRFVHTLPFLLAFLMNLKILYEVMFFQAVTSLDEYHTLMVPLILISMISYSIFMLVKCQGLYKSKVVDIRLKAKIIVSVCGVMLIPVVLFPVNLVFKNDDFNDRYVWYGSLLIMFVVILNYRFKLQTMYRENDPDKSEGKKYQSSALSGSQLNVIIGRLNEVMNQDKFFLTATYPLKYFQNQRVFQNTILPKPLTLRCNLIFTGLLTNTG